MNIYLCHYFNLKQKKENLVTGESISVPSILLSLNLSDIPTKIQLNIKQNIYFSPEKYKCTSKLEFESQFIVQLYPSYKFKKSTLLSLIKEQSSVISLIPSYISSPVLTLKAIIVPTIVPLSNI